MTERKFTPPTEFPTEYVDGYGRKVVVLARTHAPVYTLIGYDASGEGFSYTEEGHHLLGVEQELDLHDIQKRITTWHNVYEGWVGASNKVNRGATANRLCVYRIERNEDGSNPEIFVEEV